MKTLFDGLLKNEFFVMLVSGVIANTAMMAVIITVLQVPPDAILDSGLDQVLMVFEDIPE